LRIRRFFRALYRSAAAIWTVSWILSRLTTAFRSVAMPRGALPVRTREASSPRVTLPRVDHPVALAQLTRNNTDPIGACGEPGALKVHAGSGKRPGETDQPCGLAPRPGPTSPTRPGDGHDVHRRTLRVDCCLTLMTARGVRDRPAAL
jgi:hypothetical protein